MRKREHTLYAKSPPEDVQMKTFKQNLNYLTTQALGRSRHMNLHPKCPWWSVELAETNTIRKKNNVKLLLAHQVIRYFTQYVAWDLLLSSFLACIPAST